MLTFRPGRRSVLSLAAAAGLLAAGASASGGPALAQQAAEKPAPGIWSYIRQDDVHKATVLDLSGFLQVQCKAGQVSMIVLVNSEGPLSTAGRQQPIQAQLRFDGRSFPITMTEQPKYGRSSGPIQTTVFLLSVQNRGLEILDAIKKANAFVIDQGPAVFAYSAKGSGNAIAALEKGCAAG